MKAIIIFIFCLLLAGTNARARNVNTFSNIQSRIISGSPAAPGQFPWQVILRKDEIDELLCGASIIADIWVLTAAHCTYGLSSIYLTFGTVLLDDPDALSMTSTKLYIHPDYNNANLNNDVSLIQLPTALTFSDTIQPIGLVPASGATNNFVGTSCTIAGFGLIDDEYLDYSPNLLFAQVVIIDNTQCTAVYGSDVVTDSTLCAQGADGSNMSICSGDSGGPLLTRDQTGTFMQIGINSFVAQDMCTEGYPSGYVRLTSYLLYISQVTGIDYVNFY